MAAAFLAIGVLSLMCIVFTMACCVSACNQRDAARLERAVMEDDLIAARDERDEAIADREKWLRAYGAAYADATAARAELALVRDDRDAARAALADAQQSLANAEHAANLKADRDRGNAAYLVKGIGALLEEQHEAAMCRLASVLSVYDDAKADEQC